MAADRSKADQQRSDEPKVAIWDGDADGYLDAWRWAILRNANAGHSQEEVRHDA